MTYDLLIRNGRIVDGSGMPAFRGDVAVKDGKIAEIGKLSGAASRVVDAQAVASLADWLDRAAHATVEGSALPSIARDAATAESGTAAQVAVSRLSIETENVATSAQ